MQVQFVMSINADVMMSSDQRSSSCYPTRLLIYEQLTQGLAYVQCTKNRLTCKNYNANYKIVQKHQQNSWNFQYFWKQFQIRGDFQDFQYFQEL